MSNWDERSIEQEIALLAEKVDAIDPEGTGPFPFRRLFDRMGEVRAGLKDVRFRERDRRQLLWETLGSLGDRLAEIRRVFRANCEADQERVSSAIGELDSAFGSAAYGHSTWADFWGKTRETRELLKSSRFPHREARSQAWDAFNAVVDQAQDQREQNQAVREEFERDSEQHVDVVLWHSGGHGERGHERAGG